MIKAMIPKEGDIPDSYVITVTYVTGKKESFDTAHHRFVNESGFFEIATKDDLWILLPTSNIMKLEFDRSFSKIVTEGNKPKGNA